MKILYETYNGDDWVPIQDFSGVTLDDRYRVETTFKANVCVYEFVESDDGKMTAELFRRSLCHYPETLNVNLHATLFLYRDLPMCCHSYWCGKSGDCLRNEANQLHIYERTCQGG